MSKKVKRQTSKGRFEETSTSLPAASTTIKFSKSVEREFNPDYQPVTKDLKRIGALAGSFFVILIVLSFFLH